ncbi:MULTISPECIES: glycosyltransferase family 39 protein [Cyanophyceae]|uniref:glycosyltransferase family 39 protein n=1 Tax=Cyanophyceae TaxID=3028117 RepID=UPI001682DDA3|nr:glycosyltransferase family 39 protein [Trichocoleus sp. FACHB-40]MBD2006032.1 glycosyltransferase family 39 protein [Trichocoleus sp. FACHB-40]
MNQSINFFLHYLALAAVIGVGAALRFWHLDLKPLWLDEVITALFSLGRTYDDVPLNVAFPLSTLEQIFTLNPEVTWSEIAQTLATQSTHPPLFFCLMHSWLSWLNSVDADALKSWVWAVRSLPAIFGVIAIAAIYWLGSVAFSRTTGLITAAIMAVSPFGVYLSQEARHYTLPVLLITLALLGLIQIQQNREKGISTQVLVCLAWGIFNSIGFYVHYFFILAFIAQIFALIFMQVTRLHGISPTSFNDGRGKTKNIRLLFLPLAFACLPFLFYLPWLQVLMAHFNRPETSWLPSPHNIAPLYQTLAGWLVMVVSLPVENQPLWIAVTNGLLMLLFGVWLLKYVIFDAFRVKSKFIPNISRYWAILTFVIFSLCVLLQFFAVIYLLDKDITIAPRYNFVYYPAMCAILGAIFTIHLSKVKIKKATGYRNANGFFTFYFLVSFISCVFVVFNLTFQKPFNPQRVAQNMNIEPDAGLMVVVGYESSQDVALGLSFALALDKLRTPNIDALESKRSLENEKAYFAFLDRKTGYDNVWQEVSVLQTPLEKPLNLWVVAPGLKRRDYPQDLALSDKYTCNIEQTEHYRIGVPYQLYRCR